MTSCQNQFFCSTCIRHLFFIIAFIGLVVAEKVFGFDINYYFLPEFVSIFLQFSSIVALIATIVVARTDWYTQPETKEDILRDFRLFMKRFLIYESVILGLLLVILFGKSNTVFFEEFIYPLLLALILWFGWYFFCSLFSFVREFKTPSRSYEKEILVTLKQELEFNFCRLTSPRNITDTAFHPLQVEVWEVLKSGGELKFVSDLGLRNYLTSAYDILFKIKHFEEKALDDWNRSNQSLDINSTWRIQIERADNFYGLARDSIKNAHDQIEKRIEALDLLIKEKCSNSSAPNLHTIGVRS
jgi:hypothetical protein